MYFIYLCLHILNPNAYILFSCVYMIWCWHSSVLYYSNDQIKLLHTSWWCENYCFSIHIVNILRFFLGQGSKVEQFVTDWLYRVLIYLKKIRKSYCGDKTILWQSYLHNGISYNGKITSWYWIRVQCIPLNMPRVGTLDFCGWLSPILPILFRITCRITVIMSIVWIPYVSEVTLKDMGKLDL